jgi:4-amino-4-deoxy-L-arabinose transferase-like glycosyltransferase
MVREGLHWARQRTLAAVNDRGGRFLPSSFRGRLAAIVAAAVGLRLLYVLVLAREVSAAGDSQFYHAVANFLADGEGFIDPVALADYGAEVPTAAHPPLYPAVLSAVSFIGGTDTHSHRALGCLLGGVTITLIALIARRVGGDRTALIAAGIAAVYPVMLAADGALMSEGLYSLLIAATLLVAIELHSTRDARLAALLGVLIALAALTRTEALGLLALLAWPIAFAARERRLALAAVATLACALTIAPWAIRNTAAFDRPTLISHNDSTVLAGANCGPAYGAEDMGGWRRDCIPLPTNLDEGDQAAKWRRQGLEYIGDHTLRLGIVVPVRVMRTWDLWQPWRQVSFAEGRAHWAYHAGTIMYFVLMPFAIYGAYRLRERRALLLILLSPVALATIQSAVGYGLPRFRQGAEISIVVLAAFALTSILRLPWARPSRSSESLS